MPWKADIQRILIASRYSDFFQENAHQQLRRIEQLIISKNKKLHKDQDLLAQLKEYYDTLLQLFSDNFTAVSYQLTLKQNSDISNNARQNIIHFIVEEILQQKTAGYRAIIIYRYILLARILFNSSDYQSAKLIITALNEPAINRLQETFSNLPNHILMLLEQLKDVLLELNAYSEENQYKKLMLELQVESDKLQLFFNYAEIVKSSICSFDQFIKESNEKSIQLEPVEGKAYSSRLFKKDFYFFTKETLLLSIDERMKALLEKKTIDKKIKKLNEKISNLATSIRKIKTVKNNQAFSDLQLQLRSLTKQVDDDQLSFYDEFINYFDNISKNESTRKTPLHTGLKKYFNHSTLSNELNQLTSLLCSLKRLKKRSVKLEDETSSHSSHSSRSEMETNTSDSSSDSSESRRFSTTCILEALTNYSLSDDKEEKMEIDLNSPSIDEKIRQLITCFEQTVVVDSTVSVTPLKRVR